MHSESEFNEIEQFIKAQRKTAASRNAQTWASRCSSLLNEFNQLQDRVDALTREADKALGSKLSDTCIM